MADLSNLTDDGLRDHIRAGILEAESRLERRGALRLLARLRRLHGLLQDFEGDAHEAGHLVALSGGIDKP
jgi:hypothetical protein